ncbi:MAG: DUF72 domain-containing protein [Planctomycetota bacterium]
MKLYVGTAGWSYKDWEGTVYPREALADPLVFLVRYFNTIEINSSFYRPPSPRLTSRWAQVALTRAGFRFTAKLYQGFTHESPAAWKAAEIQQFLDGMAPLQEASVLGAVLAQFPWFFRAEPRSLEHLKRIAERFRGVALVLEVRHTSWIRDEMVQAITDLGYGFCNIDQPLARTSIRPGSRVTSPIGYFRMHGRNYNTWFDPKADRDSKYDYLYSPAEIDQFALLIEEIRQRTREVYVIANNHFAGKAAANALELAALLAAGKVEVPGPLLATYPQLRSIAREEAS